MFKHTIYIISLLTGIILSLPVYSQICEPSLTTQNISEENFTFDDISGTILDTVTTLRWARCAWGQEWNADKKTCEQFPIKLNWQEALKTANELVYGSNQWRLPDIKELMSIIDFQCFAPPLNATMFPQAPTSVDNGLWSATPVQTDPVSAADVKIWFIDMGEGKVKKRLWNQTNFVFFVSEGNVTSTP